jgi:hypothetical protein
VVHPATKAAVSSVTATQRHAAPRQPASRPVSVSKRRPSSRSV